MNTIERALMHALFVHLHHNMDCTPMFRQVGLGESGRAVLYLVQ